MVKKGTKVEVIVPETRARTTTILGSISPLGIVNIQLCQPTKRRLSSIVFVVNGAGGTLTGRYINFVQKYLGRLR